MFVFIVQTALLLAIAFIIGCIIGWALRWLFGAKRQDGAQTSGQAARTGAEPAAATGGAVAGAAGLGAAAATGVAAASSKDAAAPSSVPMPNPPMPNNAAGVDSPAEKTPLVGISGRGSVQSATEKPDAESPEKTAGKDETASVSSASKVAQNTTPALERAASVKTPNTPSTKGQANRKAVAKKGGNETAKVSDPAGKGTGAKKRTSSSPKAEAAAPAPVNKEQEAADILAALPDAAGKEDDLKQIKGVGPQNESRLKEFGISTFAQVAAMDKDLSARVGALLSFPGRIEREDWVAQARQLAAGQATEFSKRVAAGEVATSLGSARAEVTGAKPATLDAPRDGGADPLGAIEGVGPALEKKLNRMGIYHFDQIAALSKPEQAWLGTALGFPGRVEREDWPDKAAKLQKSGSAKAPAPKRGAIKAKK